MSEIGRLQDPQAARPAFSTKRGRARRGAVVGLGCLCAATPALAATWQSGASASATATYTSNADYSVQGQRTSDFVTTLSAAYNVSASGPRARFSGSVGASWLVYASQSGNNAIAPNVNLSGSAEVIKDFFFVDASANASTSFLSPFGPQPGDLVNATDNRYIQQTYSVSPYIKGEFGSTGVSYSVRSDNTWTASTAFGNSSNSVPSTYVSTLAASLTGLRPCTSTLSYNMTLYDSGGGPGTTNSQVFRCDIPFQVTPELQGFGRVGYEVFRQDTNTDATGRILGGNTESVVYGGGFQWSPTPRTQAGGYWEHRFFGSSFDWQIRHRLPNAAITANFSRGLNTYPQLALLVPAGTTVSQFLNAAFATRIPDPAARAQAVAEFLSRTGLPPTLVSPVNFYANTILLQNSQSISLVLAGVRDSISFSVFNTRSSNVSGSGSELPPAFQFGQNNTQTGVGVGYGRSLGAQTSLSASASYSRTKSNASDGTLGDLQAKNINANVYLNRTFGPRTTGSAGASYSRYSPYGTNDASGTDTVNVFASISYTF